MCECEGECKKVKVGQEVPCFELETYDPVNREFGKISLEAIKQILGGPAATLSGVGRA